MPACVDKEKRLSYGPRIVRRKRLCRVPIDLYCCTEVEGRVSGADVHPKKQQQASNKGGVLSAVIHSFVRGYKKRESIVLCLLRQARAGRIRGCLCVLL